MSRFLKSEENPSGEKLEDVLDALRGEILARCTRIAGDQRPEALHVLANNVRILQLLTEGIAIAKDSTKTLDRSLGPSRSDEGGPPRIGLS